MSNIIVRLYGHISLFLGIIGVGFAILVLGTDPMSPTTWLAGLVCLALAILGYKTILEN